MTSPSDRLPLELVLPHQLRMLSGPGASVEGVTVLVNQPPAWLARGGPQDGFLRGLRAAGAAVSAIDYATFDDPAFLGRFFRLRPSRLFPAPGEVSALSLARVGGMKMATNLLGMLHFLDRCLAGGAAAAELCLWLDADVLLHRRGGLGLAEAAAEAFAARPGAVALLPPSLCEPVERAGAGGCRAEAAGVASSRHLVVHRARLARLLPLDVGLTDFRLPYAGLFEDALGAGLRRAGGLWALACGAELVAVHPPHNTYELDFDGQLAALARARAETAAPPQGGFPAGWAAGARALIERVEAGRFCRAHDFCTNMRPAAARIAAGLAW